jgi:hypothetical protein
MQMEILNSLVTGWMGAGLLAGFLVGLLYLFRPYGNRKSNQCYAVLLLMFGLSLFHNFLAHYGIYADTPDLLFLPLWYTLLFGPLFFYFIKFILYPAYRFRFSDLKHLLVPLAQASFYWIVFLQDTDRKLAIYQHYYLTWFKPLEGGLFILSFFGYLALAYRYLKYRESTLRRRGFSWQKNMVRWHKVHVRVLFLLAGLNTFYILADFISFNFFQINLYNLPGFAYLSDLSFTAVLLWLAGKGAQWAFGRRLARRLAVVPPDPEVRDPAILVQQEKRYLDPDLRPTHLAYALNLSSTELSGAIQHTYQMDFRNWLGDFRIQEMERRMEVPLYQKYHPVSLALVSGFPSAGAYYRKQKNGRKNPKKD